MAKEVDIFLFSKDHVDGDASMVELLGGKGANLSQMCKMGLPVPAGLIIPTTVCRMWSGMSAAERDSLLDDLMPVVTEGVKWIEEQQGGPCLFSVRSGAPVSMPGMMDTILNVGIHDGNFNDWVVRLGDTPSAARVALDCERRLIQMLGSTAYGVPHDLFEALLSAAKEYNDVQQDKDLCTSHMDLLVGQYRNLFEEHTENKFPSDTQSQLRASIRAVFDSWMNQRAVDYRKLNGIPETMGTAVVVQAMVFGNFNDKSCSGVLFTRSPSDGSAEMYGEYLVNAQGEDVVAGVRTPDKLEKMNRPDSGWEKIYVELMELCETLEEQYKDMMDVEFTVQDGKLYVLQCRVGKRSAFAAIKIALDFTLNGVSKEQALKRITAAQYKSATSRVVDPSFALAPAGIGIPASPGVVAGMAAFTSAEAVELAKAGKMPLLVTKETTPDDIMGMHSSVGILTSTGGATSHAAVVARGMDKACVVGLTAMSVEAGKVSIDGAVVNKGDIVTICGSTGRVWVCAEVPVVSQADNPYIGMLRDIAMERLNAIPVASEDAPLGGTYVPAATLLDAKWRIGLDAIGADEEVVIGFDTVDSYPSSVVLLHDMFETGGGLFDKVLPHLKACKTQEAITIVGLTPEQRNLLKDTGFKFGGIPKTIKDLLTMGRVQVTDDFVKSVFGDAKAYKLTIEALAGKHKMGKPLKTPANRDYAVYKVLQGSKDLTV